MKRVLIVDDEPGVRLALGDQLRAEGYEVNIAADGEEGFSKARTATPDLLVVDVMMPKLNGFQLCQRLRQDGCDVAILFLSAKSEETDIVLGLGFGADDYITKPFSVREVVARIEAVLRRTARGGHSGRALKRFAFGEIELDFERLEARRGTVEVELTPREFRILHFFAQRPGEVVTRDDLLDAVWGEDVWVASRSVDNQIYGIRQKLEDDPHHPSHIVSIRSVGYKLVVDDGDSA